MKYPVKIIIGLTGGVGANLDAAYDELEHQFKDKEFKVFKIKISDFFDNFKLPQGSIDNQFLTESKHGKKLTSYHKKMSSGNLIRFFLDDNSVLARLAVMRIHYQTDKHDKQVYIIDQIKRIEEFRLLRKIYGRSFFMMGIFHDEQRRMDRLSRKIKDFDSRRNLIERDKQEDFVEYKSEKKDCGQCLSKVFTQSHLFVDAGDIDKMRTQIIRFIRMLLGRPFLTPSIDESCMYLAKGVSARSADLGRQVGAVAADERGNILAVGYNDVPKAGGGFHVAGDAPDLRDFMLGYSSNKKEIMRIKGELVKHLGKEDEKLCEMLSKRIQNKNALDDLIEYGRSVHAEEAVICDAAVRGVSLKGATLYCTTFPCHLCAKLIIAVGIKRIVYIDPYPKSKVKDLFEHSVSLNQEFYESGKIVFEPFIGIAPRRFIHFFIRDLEQKFVSENGDLESDKNSFISHLKNRNASIFYIREAASNLRLTEAISNHKELSYKDNNMPNKTLPLSRGLDSLLNQQDTYTDDYTPKKEDQKNQNE